ncbi:MAG: type II and III secretion system protein family protein [Kiloniellales bacterium]|nr:type II and III secretion system protein family protein [Kiloniellales bacterium]
MTRNNSLKTTLAALVLLAGGVFPPLTEAAQAQSQSQQIGPGDESVTLEVNEGRLIRLNSSAESVFIANSQIADVNVKSPRMIYMFGKKPGETTLYALDRNDNVVANARVVVSHNLSRLNTALSDLLPAGGVTASSVDGGIILTGAVASATDAEDVRRLTTRFIGKGEEIINRISVTQANQVNLRVRIADVSRQVIESFGFSWDALFDSGDFAFRITTGTLFPPIAHQDGGLTADSALETGDWNLNNLIDALASDGLVTILAEPNLTALSGETASFLSGGEFPVPTDVTDGETSVEFKEFGVSLAFTPTILNDNRISMRVRPEVSELSDIGAISFNGIEIPGISTRRAETTVELASGQSFAIAGLRLDARRQDNDDIPGLGNIPLLGALFQQNRLEKREQELLIVVTPYVVTPTSTEIPLPTDPYMAPMQPADGEEANTASTPQTVPLRNGGATASASSAQTGFILE